jgi:hypothetical protein
MIMLIIMMMIFCATLYSLGPDIISLVSVVLFRNILYSPQERKPYENTVSPDRAIFGVSSPCSGQILRCFGVTHRLHLHVE